MKGSLYSRATSRTITKSRTNLFLGTRSRGMFSNLNRQALTALTAILAAFGSSTAQTLQPNLIEALNNSNGIIANQGDPVALSVIVTTRAGAPITAAPVIFIAPELNNPVSFPNAAAGAPYVRTQTAADGTASATLTVNATSGVFLIDAFIDGTSSAVTFALTVNADNVAPAVTPDVARNAVRDQILHSAVEDETLRLHGPFLLNSGARVFSAGPPADLPASSKTPSTPSWLFWIGDAPNSRFAHPVRYLLTYATASSPDFTG